MVVVTVFVAICSRLGAWSTVLRTLPWGCFWPPFDGKSGSLGHALHDPFVQEFLRLDLFTLADVPGRLLGQRLRHGIGRAVADPMVEAVVRVIGRSGARTMCSSFPDTRRRPMITSHGIDAPP